MNGKKSKKVSYKPKGRLRARLSFDDGFAERPIYSIKAFTNEKGKGVSMIELIQDNFDITSLDIKNYQQMKFNELTSDFQELEKKTKRKSIQWLRDEKGNIISPFGNKAKEMEKAKE